MIIRWNCGYAFVEDDASQPFARVRPRKWALRKHFLALKFITGEQTSQRPFAGRLLFVTEGEAL